MSNPFFHNWVQNFPQLSISFLLKLTINKNEWSGNETVEGGKIFFQYVLFLTLNSHQNRAKLSRWPRDLPLRLLPLLQVNCWGGNQENEEKTKRENY